MKKSKQEVKNICRLMSNDYGRLQYDALEIEKEIKRIYRNGYKVGLRKRK